MGIERSNRTQIRNIRAIYHAPFNSHHSSACNNGEKILDSKRYDFILFAFGELYHFTLSRIPHNLRLPPPTRTSPSSFVLNPEIQGGKTEVLETRTTQRTHNRKLCNLQRSLSEEVLKRQCGRWWSEDPSWSYYTAPKP